MRMNRHGEIAEGREVYWPTDELTARQVGSDAEGWTVQTSAGVVLSKQGATKIAARAGKWAAYPPARGNFGVIPDGGIVLDIGDDGTVIWCANQQAGTPIGIFGGQTYNVHQLWTRAVAGGEFVVAQPDGSIWSNVRGLARIPAGVKAASAHIVADWLLYHTDRWLVLQRFDQPTGVVVAEAPTYSPDMVQLPDGALKVAWCPNPEETNAQAKVYPLHFAVTDLSGLRDAPVSIPVPQPPPEPTPMSIPDQTGTIAAIRAKYPTPMGDQHAAALMEMARATGAKLLKKDSGSHVTLPNGINVAQDILVFSNGQECFDVLGDAEGKAIPSWQPKGAIAGEYIDVSAAPVPSEPPPVPQPSGDVAELLSILIADVRKLSAHLGVK